MARKKKADFNTADMGDKEHFLGIKFSPELVSNLNIIYPFALDYGRRKARELVTPVAEGFARAFLKTDPKTFAKVVGHVAEYGVIFGKQLGETGKIFYNSVSSLNELHKEVSPLKNVSGTGALSGNNEVVANARGKITGIGLQNFKETAVTTISAGPTFLKAINERIVAKGGKPWLPMLAEPANPNDSDMPKELRTGMWGVGAQMIAGFINNLSGAEKREQFKQPIALDYILKLRKVMDESKDDKPPEDIPTPQGSQLGNHLGYVDYVHQIFQQHQADCGNPEIGKRFFAHFAKAGWNDDRILDSEKLPDEDLTAYEFAVRTIASRIKTGRMDPISLITLVGDKREKIVHDDGHSFGLLGRNKDEDKVRKSLEELIDKHSAQVQDTALTDKEFNDKLGNFVFSIPDLKAALESNELKPSERAFIFTAFSDVMGTDAKLCKRVGLSRERCLQLRKEANDTFSDMLDNAVIILADLIKKQPDEMDKHMTLTDEEKKLILTLASRIREEGKHVSELNDINKADLSAVETVVANAGVTNAPGFLERLVSARKNNGEAVVKPEGAIAPRYAKKDGHSGPLAEKHARHASHESVVSHSRDGSDSRSPTP